MGKRSDRQFWESARMNNITYQYYYNKLIDLALSRFEWKNLPKSIDERYLELALMTDGKVLFFKDEDLGNNPEEQYLALRGANLGKLNVYGIPQRRRAIGFNGYNKNLEETDSVIIWNNKLRMGNVHDLEMFATRLYDLDRSIDVNARAQKTPVLIKTDEKQRLTLLNVYQKFDGNQPVIFGDKNLNTEGVKVFNTNAPYVADKLYELKNNIYNDALTYLGISNVNIQKKERMITDEVTRNQGGVIANRNSYLQMRKEACKQINDMFGLNIDVEFMVDYRETDDEFMIDEDGNKIPMVEDVRTKE